jgi:hypothetical protein
MYELLAGVAWLSAGWHCLLVPGRKAMVCSSSKQTPSTSRGLSVFDLYLAVFVYLYHSNTSIHLRYQYLTDINSPKIAVAAKPLKIG